MPHPRLCLLAAISVAALLAGGCGAGTANPTAPFAGASITIQARGLAFSPDIVTAPANVPLRLVLDNQDQGVSDDLRVFQGGTELGRSPAVVGPGYASVELPPLAPGRYQFASTTHPDMIGTIIVAVGASAGASPVPSAGPSAVPSGEPSGPPSGSPSGASAEPSAVPSGEPSSPAGTLTPGAPSLPVVNASGAPTGS